jgi:Domain of unknown function DUF11
VDSVRAIRIAAAVLAVAPVMLAVPAAAQAKIDLSITSTPSARLVAPGQTVNFEFTVANQGTEAFKAVYVNLFSLRGHGLPANNPYTSVSPSQGVCKNESGSTSGYQTWTCELGALAPEASATIMAAVTVNESMNHIAALLPNPFEGGYEDENNSNNEAVDRIAVSTPPAISGSKLIKLKGLPSGCVPGDFTLRVSTKAPGVKKISASMELGYNAEGIGQSFQKVVRGRKLVAKVPMSRAAVELGKTYKLHIKAKKGGGRKLEKVIMLTPCGA